MGRAGTRIRCTPGNHDPLFPELLGSEVVIAPEHEHTTADGRRLLITHGDLFDGELRARRWLGVVGDALARMVERACLAIERVCRARRARMGLAVKERGKRLFGYTRRFERSALRAARARAVDGIVCGHVHTAASRTVDGLYYGNGGDWVGSATALVEHPDGRMELVQWRPSA